MKDLGEADKETVLNFVAFARCTITAPLSWKAYKELSALELLQEYAASK
jgi:hypothetical protein